MIWNDLNLLTIPVLMGGCHFLKEFHDIFGNIDWTDEDKVRKQIADLPDIVSKDETYQNAMRYSDRQNARAESDNGCDSGNNEQRDRTLQRSSG